MSDKPTKAEPVKPKQEPPAEPVANPPMIDQGLVAWAELIRSSVGAHAGVEDIQSGGGSVSFRFRGQTFIVSVSRTS